MLLSFAVNLLLSTLKDPKKRAKLEHVALDILRHILSAFPNLRDKL